MIEVANIEPSMIEPDPDQPRKVFDRDGLIELMDSMKHNGLLQPIIVRPLNGSGKYRLIAGERRWRSATELGWNAIPAIIRDDVDELTAAKLQLLENITRRDLNPVEEARAYQRFAQQGMSIVEVAAVVGKRPADISNRIEMLKAREDILELVARGHLSANLCWYMARLSYNNQGVVLKKMAEEGLPLRQAAMLCEALLAKEQQIDMFPETKLTEQQQEVVRMTKSALEKACKAVADLLKIDKDNPGTIGTAMATEADVTIRKLNELILMSYRLEKVLQRKQLAASIN